MCHAVTFPLPLMALCVCLDEGTCALLLRQHGPVTTPLPDYGKVRWSLHEHTTHTSPP